MDIKTYNITEFAKKVGTSTKSLRRWHNEGKFTAYTQPSGRLFYTEELYEKYLTMAGLRKDEDQ